ncbi:MAG: methyl-accepting chemotaxis protein [Pseudomonadota bacterium]
MRALTVKLQLILLTALIVTTLILVGGTGYLGTAKQGETLFDMDVKMSAVKYQMEADMMHDAIRGDVMTALYAAQAGDTDQQTMIEEEYADHAEKLQANITNTLDMDVSSDINVQIDGMQAIVDEYLASAQSLITLAFQDSEAAADALMEFTKVFMKLEASMSDLGDTIRTAADEAALVANGSSEETLSLMQKIIIASMVIGIAGCMAVLRGILKPLNRLHSAIEAIRSNKGKLERVSGFNGEFRNIENAFNGVLDDLETKRLEDSKIAEAAFRVRQALNAATTNVVLTDANMQVIYVNETAAAMFRKAEASIRKTLARFSTSQMLGGNLEQFFPKAEMARDISLATTPRSDEIKLGDNTYHVISTAVYDENGQKLGVVCEWKDLSEQREAERQIESVLQDAINGRLDTRLDASAFHGFMNTLSLGVNNMLDAITGPLRIAASQLKEIAEGQIPQPITIEFKGEFNEIRTSLNTCSKVLKALIQDTTMLVEAASKGKLDARVDVSNHWGDYRAIVEGMNNTLDAIAKPVSEVKDVITGFASGDLTKRMSNQYGGDFAVLSDAVNASVNNLVDMVSRIHDSSYNINTSASEISVGNQNLNERTQEQAAALEETSSTLQNLTARAEENTANAKSANQLAQSATNEAKKGGEIVYSAVQAMAEINEASTKIANIITVIDGISFQTNLLALNASVEAARAGEQGRGFAVVANEVRALAQRSATAAQEIKLLINDTVGKVDHGSKLVNESGVTLRDIVDSINKVGTIISEISASTSEQMDGFLEVSRSINSLDEMTQQNAALVEEAAAASESMADQSNTLRELMNFFKTDENARQVTFTANKPQAPARSASRTPARSSARTAARPAARAEQRIPKPSLKVVAGSPAEDDNNWSEF